MMLVVLLYTVPFFHKRRMSFNGCKMPGPFRPEARLFTRTTMPVKNRLVNKMRTKLIILHYNWFKKANIQRKLPVSSGRSMTSAMNTTPYSI